MPETIKCACVSIDAYACWARRYNMTFACQAIEDSGGPCQCVCHDDERDEDE